MKIARAGIEFSSEHQFKQMESIVNQQIDFQSNQPAVPSQDGNRQSLPGRGRDVVRISQAGHKALFFKYAATAQSVSSVESFDSDLTADHEMHHTLQHIVGGAIDAEVAIRRINEQKTADNKDKRIMPFATLRSQASGTQRELIQFERENLNFDSRGQVYTEDGRQINFSLKLSLERSFFSKEEQLRLEERINMTDPLVISLDGKAPVLRDTVFEFDLDNDGDMEDISFTAVGSGWLALDKNADNVINNGSELFGPSTGNGFQELSGYDEDQNRWIDENDAVFSQLSVWTKDADGNDRMISLKEAGVGAIALDYADTAFQFSDAGNDQKGRLRRSGVFLFEDGRAAGIHQIDLADRKPLRTDAVRIRMVPNADVLPLKSVPEIFETVEDISDPLKDLLEKIKALKEKMSRILGEKSNEQDRLFSHRYCATPYEAFRLTPGQLNWRI